METITLTLSKDDAAIIERSLLFAAMTLQNESHSPQNSKEVRDSFFKASKVVSDILVDISNLCEKHKEQEDA